MMPAVPIPTVKLVTANANLLHNRDYVPLHPSGLPVLEIVLVLPKSALAASVKHSLMVLTAALPLNAAFTLNANTGVRGQLMLAETPIVWLQLE